MIAGFLRRVSKYCKINHPNPTRYLYNLNKVKLI